MAIIQRFSAIDKAILVLTGNSFIVCGSSTEAEMNTSDLIKPDGTITRDWTQSGSTANLNILKDSTILYAELIWYSTVFSNAAGAVDLTSIQDNPIVFTTLQGSYEITPQYTQSYTSSSSNVERYRAADVTTYIQAALSGNYTVSNVPISVPPTGLSNSRGAWSLSVVYRNNILKPQKILYSSGIDVATPSSPLQLILTGFTTSSDQALLKGSLGVVCANGGPLNGEEFVLVGPSTNQLRNIGNPIYSPNPNPGLAPNNPGNNFFAGAINISNPINEYNGLINMNGTNGTKNNDGFIPSQLIGARNKLDITNVNISDTLVPNQTLLAIQVISGALGEGVEIISLATQVSTKAPNIIVVLEAFDVDGDNEFNVELGDNQVYGVKVKNEGTLPAYNFTVWAVINPATTFIPGSVLIDNVSYPLASIIDGVNVGTIKPNGIAVVVFRVKVNSVPPGGMLYQNANYSYEFVSGVDTIVNEGTTNTLEIIVQEAKLDITKSASTTVMRVNDIVTYTTEINNVGTEITRNMFFQDTIDESCSFVRGSVVIDGVSYVDYNPVIGINLPDLQPNYSTQIVFQCKLNSVTASTKVTNISFITFAYIYNQFPYLRKKTTASNITSIQIEFIDIIEERCSNNNYPQVGDIVTYTLSLTNMGNIPAYNVQVLEPVIPGATFINGSVKINGVSEPTLNPFTGFTLPEPINPKETTVVEYEVLIYSLDPTSLIENVANIPFKYKFTQEGTIIDLEKISNIVDTVAKYICMNIVKSVNTAYADVGDTLYYTVNITNSGNINGLNVVFQDSLESALLFIDGSVTINGIAYSSYNPSIGFSIGTICPGDIITVEFECKVVSTPIPNVIYNDSSIIYQYQPNPSGPIYVNTIFTNIVETVINQVQYSVVKSVNKDYVQVGDTLVYVTTIKNTGTVTLTNMKFADYIPDFLSFYQGSVFINGINYPNLNPSTQFPFPDMEPGDATTIIFQVLVLVNPPTSLIINMAEVTMSYRQNPNSPLITKTVYSNQVETIDPSAIINLVKYVDKNYAAVGEILTYSFTVTNDGTATAINILFTDVLQKELSFIPETVKIDGEIKASYNPQIGFSLEDISVGQVTTIEFKAIVDSSPNPNNIDNSAITVFSYFVDPRQQPVTRTTRSNTVTTVINTYSSSLTKVVDKDFATIGDILNYTVTAINSGTVPLTNVFFKDLIQNGATFIEGSVVVNGERNPEANPNQGFLISDITSSSSEVIIFQVRVTSLPTSQQINNTADITLRYQLSPTAPIVDDSLTSNTVTTNVNVMSIVNTKSVNKAYATLSDILTYTSVISNTGNISAENTNFIDVISKDLTFVAGSVIIDGILYPTYNPNVGFTLGTIPPNSNITITFNVIVKSVPLSGYVINTASINYEYKINPSEPYSIVTVNSNNVTTYIKLGDLTITKESNRTIAKLNNVITYNFVIKNIGNTILQNLLFKDSIQGESTFNTGSVYVNDVNMESYDPNIGFSLEDIEIGQETTISFQVTTNSIPLDNKLLNSGDVTYSYYVDPQGSLTTKTKTSNITTVNVYDTIISADKYSDKSIVKIGEIINYTIVLVNDGEVTAQNNIFQDILDSSTEFVIDSVYIDGINKIGYDPNIGFNLDDIGAGETTSINFQVTVISRPNNNIIYNFATVNYDYTIGSKVIVATMDTDIAKIKVEAGDLRISKVVDNSYATIGDSLVYTVVLTNAGSVNTTNLYFQDLIESSATFNVETVVVDGVPQPTFNPNIGFTLSDLKPKNSHTVTFSVNIVSFPQNGELSNSADVTFTYQLTPTDTPVTITSSSNIIITYIKVAKLLLTKSVDKFYATIGEVLYYTIKINNTGNATCFNVFVQDIIQSNASFVTGSVIINGIKYSDYNPNTGFYLEDISGYGAAVIIFEAVVQTLPTDYIIYNYATATYKYYVDPTNPSVLDGSNSNTISTTIIEGKIIATKSVDKSYATIGDVVTYTVYVKNTGNTLAKNVNFRDVVPLGLKFVIGTVKINGVAYETYDPNISFTLGNIIANRSVVVTFDVIVTQVPNPSEVSNTATIIFSYKINPNASDITSVVDSNAVVLKINIGSLSLVKSVDRTYVTLGDLVNYTVVVINNGNVKAEKILFTDNLQSDVLFNDGTVQINEVSYPTYDPNKGFYLENLEPLEKVTVSFSVTVIQASKQIALLNYAVGTFEYKVNPNKEYYSKSSQSNTVLTWIIDSGLSSTKIVDKVYAKVQDTLNYTIVVENRGNVTISEIFFKDFLSEGAVFKAGTVVINGVKYPNYNPIIGFDVPRSLVSQGSLIVEFQATVIATPSSLQVENYAVVNGIYYVNPEGPSNEISTITNTVITNISTGSLSNTKTVNKSYALVNEVLNYTSTIINTGNINLTNLFFSDTIESNLSFIPGTVNINGIIYPTLNPIVGFELSNLLPSQTLIIGFSVQIIALPVEGYITNISEVKFSYKIDPNGSLITKYQPSNTVVTNVVLANLTAVKAVNKLIATLGDELIYTVTLTNIGNVIVTDVLFQDILSPNLIFKSGSVKVNNISEPTYDPIIGFSLGNIDVGVVVVVSFIAIIVSIPPNNRVTNQAIIPYKYTIDPNMLPYSNTAYSNIVTTEISYGNLEVSKSVDKLYATIGDELTYTITIINVGNINATSVEFEDQIPSNTMFVTGSVTVNGISYPEYNPSAGFNLGTMTPGQIIAVAYRVKILNLC